MAPNLVTLTGSLILFSSLVLILCLDWTLARPLPAWVFIYAGVSVILYQTFDAMDGKQARRTNSSSALGQLFDHGCDAFAATCLVMLGAQCLRLGNTYLSLGLLFGLEVAVVVSVDHLLLDQLGGALLGHPSHRRGIHWCH